MSTEKQTMHILPHMQTLTLNLAQAEARKGPL